MIHFVMTYSLDFRRQVLLVKEKEKLTFDQVAERFCVGSASVKRWAKAIHPKPYPCRKRKIDLEKLAKDVEDHPDDYQYERAARFGVAQSSVHAALKQMDVTYKKSVAPSQG